MDASRNGVELIYQKVDLFHQQLNLIESVKMKITDNEYLCLMNNLKKIKDLDVVYKIVYNQTELLGRPDSRILDINIIKNTSYCFENLNSADIDFLENHVDDTVSILRLTNIGFNIPEYSAYSLAGFNQNVLVNNSLLKLISFEEI